MQMTVAGVRASRDEVRRLSGGLIVYGVAGLALAFLALLAFGWVGARVTSISDSVDGDVAQMTTTLERTADTLHDTGRSASSFEVTLERTPPSIRQAAGTIRNLRPNLEEIERQLGSIELLGTAPLTVPARLFGQIALDLEGLDTRLETIADDLDADRGALHANAASLVEAGDQAAILAERLRMGSIQHALDELKAVLLVTILVIAASVGAPATGALLLGWWMWRRSLVPTAGERSTTM